MKLALAWGRPLWWTKQHCPMSEFIQWLIFDTIEPFGAHRDNLHAGIVASAALAPYSKREPPKPTDFMLQLPKPPMTTDEMKKRILHMNRLLGGEVKRGESR